MKKKVVVFGCGLVGRVIVRDLSRDDELSVTVVDRSESALESVERLPLAERLVTDLSDPTELARVASRHDLVVGALPGFLGFASLRSVIDVGVPYVDISFMPEDPLLLHEAAVSKGVTAVVDCGVAPGMSNLIVGRAASTFDRLERVLILVGGLPVLRMWPFEYKAVFSPIDVIEEYTRPARFVEYGRIVEREALSEAELVDLPGVGTLEAFNTDGLRSIAKTIKAPFMKEKTLRYPGHIEKMRMMREAGFFGTEPIDVGGVSVRPIDVTSRLMFPKWKMQPTDRDLTVMRVVIDGYRGDRLLRTTYDLLDHFEEGAGESSMSRTTGFPCAIAVRLILDGTITTTGVLPPEVLGPDPRVYNALMQGLESRGVRFRESVEELSLHQA